MTYRFHVPGVVKSERKRQRFIPGKGRVGARTDEPDRADFKSRVALFATQAIPAPLECPVALELRVMRPRPASYPKKPTEKNWHTWADTKKPDCDNYAKIVQDALNGIAFVDDAQIISLQVHKGFGDHGVTVIVREVGPDSLGALLAGAATELYSLHLGSGAA